MFCRLRARGDRLKTHTSFSQVNQLGNSALHTLPRHTLHETVTKDSLLSLAIKYHAAGVLVRAQRAQPCSDVAAVASRGHGSEENMTSIIERPEKLSTVPAEYYGR